MTKDELLKWLKGWRISLENHGWSLQDEEVYDELCNFIEQGKPMVSKREARKVWDNLAFASDFFDWLRKLGLEVSE